MASPSGGTMPPQQPIVDANQAVALLATMHHWSATKLNREQGKPRYSVSITHAGCRVTANRDSFISASIAAIKKLHIRFDKKHGSKHQLKLARYPHA